MENNYKAIKNYCLSKLIGQGSFGESLIIII